MNKNNKYQRQIILPEWGQEAQDRLAEAKILVVGAGGLGCPALQYLAAAGTGTIGIVDNDYVDLTNLQRQILFTPDDIGKNKAGIAKQRLQQLSPDLSVNAVEDRITPKNAKSIIEAYDVIIDGTDNFASKFLLNAVTRALKKPLIYGSVLQFGGQVAVFNHHDQSPCYQCLFPEMPQQGSLNCAEAGVIGALAGIVGSMQAMEALKIIARQTALKPLSGQLLTIDARTMQTKTLNLQKDPNCKTCSTPKTEDTTMTAIQEISVQDAKNRKNIHFIDVRERDEWQNGHIDGAEHVPLSEFMEGKRPALAADKTNVFYCAKGMRSEYAARVMASEGSRNIYSLEGGYDEWQKTNN